MSYSNPNSYASQRPGQHSPLLTAPKTHRPRQAQSQYHNTARHTHNASITSNPSQGSQQAAGEPDFWLGSYPTTVTSPGSFHQAPDIYNFDEDNSHHESSFDDFLTTENSSENPLSEHTTPQELIWEQQFVLQDPTQPHILDSYGSATYEAARGDPGSAELQNILRDTEERLPKFVSGEDLLGSTLNTSTAPVRHLPSLSQSHSQSEDRQMNRSLSASSMHQGSVSRTLRVDTTSNDTPSPNQKVGSWQQHPIMRATSPVVMVSSYETTGPGLATLTTIAPSSAKRSRGSESSHDNELGDNDDDPHDSDPRDGSVYSSRLIPPDAHDIANVHAGHSVRAGLEPNSRGDEVVLSVKDLEEQRHRDERNADVQTWLATSEAGSEPEDDASATNSRRQRSASRRRAQTNTAQRDALGHVYSSSDRELPGPGALVHVDSDDEYFDDVSVSSEQIQEHTDQVVGNYEVAGSPHLSPHALEGRESPDETASFPTLETSRPGADEEPLPNQFIRRGPWQDPVRGPITETKHQPNTSNAAAYKFNEEAAKWETASRAATWGTRRRLSESEVASIVDGSQVRHLSLSKRGRERGASILNKARGLLPRRSSSNIKVEEQADNKEAVPLGHAHRTSVGSNKPAQRMPSFSKPKSPSLSTGFMAMTGSLTAVGAGNSVAQEADASKSLRTLPSLKKRRSRSEVSKNAKSSSGGLAELMTRHGGPPVPTLASPMHEREPILAAQVIDNEDAAAEDDDDDHSDEVAIKMDLEVRAEDITPTLEGFKDHARKLNPRLEPYLVERIGQEQIRRYKKLVETKIKHTRSVQESKKCSSGKFCFELGGNAMLLAPRVNSKDPDAAVTQFQVSNPADEENDEMSFTEGVVTPALFPSGIPLPPVQRLPAEFECNLCFRVKKFQKPSDWTKHVHEDIQPFSCTFPNCAESKSFKRKADWVRHENERHRHLEWWRCSYQECSHICYRKDNFVQHLVREHKMTEPKTKSKGSGSSKYKPANSGFQEENEVWRMVEQCRLETHNKPRDEPCRFCGNICSSFKKLSVHMGKHMEQIALPVLQLVNMREVSPDTIISPIEQLQSVPASFGTLPGPMHQGDANNLSPYPTSTASQYQTSSAGQSPSSLHGRAPSGGYQFDQAYYSPHGATQTSQGAIMNGSYGATGTFMQHSPIFLGSSPMRGQSDHNLSPQTALVAPRSQPMGSGYESGFYEPTEAIYTQASAPMHGMYPSMHSHSHSHSHTTPGYVLGQYGASMLPSQTSGPPPGPSLDVNDRTGLGLQADMGQQSQYLYGIPGNGEGGASMHYS